MRIALISSAFLPTVGGMEWKVHYLAEEYTRLGHDVTVFTGRPDLAFAKVPLPVVPIYDVVRCGFPFRGMDRLGISKWLYRRAVLARHRRVPFDVMHSHHLGLPTQFAVSVKAVTGTPVLATTCGGDVQVLPQIGYGDRLKPRFDRLVRRNVRRVDVVASISNSMRQELERIGTTARIVDIPNGVPWETFQAGGSPATRDRLGVSPKAPVVLSVGRNQRVKGYEFGLRAFEKTRRSIPAAVYVIVGRNVVTLAPRVAALGLDSNVRLVDQVAIDELPEIFHAADVFFSPSLMEGFSQVNLQAMSSGLPCVLTDAPGNRDAAADGGAIVARSGDVDSMAEALTQLLADATVRARLGREAHRASKRYAWSRVAADYEAVFRQLVANG